MNEVYKFFNFGANFINQIETLGNNRKACIILDDSSMSENFQLEVGRSQGNGPSPVEYNLAQQILIFKLELDDRVASVFRHMLVPRPIGRPDTEPENTLALEQWIHLEKGTPTPAWRNNRPALEGPFSQESNRETDIADAFADDTTTIPIATYSCLKSIADFLDEFRIFSGLKCNIDKTALMFIGPDNGEREKITGLGFEVVKSIHLLGTEIDDTCSQLKKNFNKTIEKIYQLTTFWARFNLSLPGRINVSKSLMLPLVTYLGSIIMPEKKQLVRMQSLNDDFV
jgi:hypothetical protein